MGRNPNSDLLGSLKGKISGTLKVSKFALLTKRRSPMFSSGVLVWHELSILGRTQADASTGPKVDCGLHNHSDAIFGEFHLSLSAGTGNGGMWWLPSGPTIGPKEFEIPNHKESDFARLPLGSLDEHGAIWYRENCKTLRRADSTVCYPWHKWQAGGKAKDMDVWMAIELSPLWLD